MQSLPGMDIRPTSDRLRETLFDILCAGNPQALEGTVWVDLYAGTGAVGIEALSRGAAQVTFVESSAKAAALIAKNLRSLGVMNGFAIMRSDAVMRLRKLQAGGGASLDYVFLDPPYRMEQEYGGVLRALGDGSVLKASSIVVAEHDRRFDPGEEHGILRRYRELRQGDAGLSFYRVR